MIAVIGLGFVGLTTALGFCEKGCHVTGYDIHSGKIADITKGCIPFYEPHLDEALQKHLGQNFQIAGSIGDAVRNARVIFYCVGTPSHDDGSADLQFLYAAIEQTLQCIEDKDDDYKVLVIKSTVPPGTSSEKVQPFIEDHGFIVGETIGIANNPEFLREGYAWDDFMSPARIVVGTVDKKSRDILQEIYKPFDAPIHSVSLNTGEFIKYLSNTLLATLISYANDMSMAADAIGDIDIPRAFNILHQDKRWSGQPANMTSYVYPGCGYGGYCLPKDTSAIYMQAKAKGHDSPILRSVTQVNARIKDFVVNKLMRAIMPHETIGILGLAFKANSDDVRETPARAIIGQLLEHGYTNIIAYDPLANENFEKTYQLNLRYTHSIAEIVQQADHLVLLTGWQEFRQHASLLQNKPVHDFRYYL